MNYLYNKRTTKAISSSSSPLPPTSSLPLPPSTTTPGTPATATTTGTSSAASVSVSAVSAGSVSASASSSYTRRELEEIEEASTPPLPDPTNTSPHKPTTTTTTGGTTTKTITPLRGASNYLTPAPSPPEVTSAIPSSAATSHRPPPHSPQRQQRQPQSQQYYQQQQSLQMTTSSQSSLQDGSVSLQSDEMDDEQYGAASIERRLRQRPPQQQRRPPQQQQKPPPPPPPHQQLQLQLQQRPVPSHSEHSQPPSPPRIHHPYPTPSRRRGQDHQDQEEEEEEKTEIYSNHLRPSYSSGGGGGGGRISGSGSGGSGSGSGGPGGPGGPTTTTKDDLQAIIRRQLQQDSATSIPLPPNPNPVLVVDGYESNTLSSLEGGTDGGDSFEDESTLPDEDEEGISIVREPSVVEQEPTTLATMMVPGGYQQQQQHRQYSLGTNGGDNNSASERYHDDDTLTTMDGTSDYRNPITQHRVSRHGPIITNLPIMGPNGTLVAPPFRSNSGNNSDNDDENDGNNGISPPSNHYRRKRPDMNHRRQSRESTRTTTATEAGIFCYGNYGVYLFISTIILLAIAIVIIQQPLQQKNDQNNIDNNNSTTLFPSTSTSNDDEDNGVPLYPTISPTISPTTILSLSSNLEWINIDGDLIGSDIDDGSGNRFGHSITMNHNGTIIACSSPWYNNGIGQVSLHRLIEIQDDDKETKLQWEDTTQILSGVEDNEQFGRSIAMNANGTILAISSLGYSNFRGLVQVYYYDTSTGNDDDNGGIWVPLGNSLSGTNENDCFGRSISLSDDGTILAISSSRYMVNETSTDFLIDTYPIDGLIQIYQLQQNFELHSNINTGQEEYVVTSSTWIPLGQEIRGITNSLEECGATIELDTTGTILAIGCPRWSGTNGGGTSGTTTSNTNRGRVIIYQLVDSGFIEVPKIWEPLGTSLYGTTQNDYLGTAITIAGGNDDDVGNDVGNERGQYYFCTAAAVGYTRCYELRGSSSSSTSSSPYWSQIGQDIASLLPSSIFAASLSLTSNNGLVLVSGIYFFIDWQISPGFSTIHFFQEENKEDNDDDSSSPLIGEWNYIGGDFVIGLDIGDRYGISTAISSDGMIVAVSADSSNGGTGHVKVFGATRADDNTV